MENTSCAINVNTSSLEALTGTITATSTLASSLAERVASLERLVAVLYSKE